MSTFLHYVATAVISLLVGVGGGFYLGVEYGKKAAQAAAQQLNKLG